MALAPQRCEGSARDRPPRLGDGGPRATPARRHQRGCDASRGRRCSPSGSPSALPLAGPVAASGCGAGQRGCGAARGQHSKTAECPVEVPPSRRRPCDVRRAGRARAPHRGERSREDDPAAGRRHREPQSEDPGGGSRSSSRRRAVRAAAASAHSGTSSTTPTGQPTIATSSSSSSAAMHMAEPIAGLSRARHRALRSWTACWLERSRRGRTLRRRSCRRATTAWSRKGSTSARYTSAESAADLVDLRAALGYDAWNLYGVSYGSRLAMTMMRDHPEGLRSVILDGAATRRTSTRYETLPTGYMTALDTPARAHAPPTPTAARPYPDLEADSRAAARRRRRDADLGRRARIPSTDHAVRLDCRRHRGHRRAVRRAVRRGPGARPAVRHRPARARQHRTDRFRSRSAAWTAGGYFTEGLDLSVECAEEAPFNDDARHRRGARGGSDPRALRGRPEGFRERLRGVGGARAVGDREPGGRERDPDADHERRLRPRHAARLRPGGGGAARACTTCTSSRRWVTDRSGRTGSTSVRHPSPSSSCAIRRSSRTRRASPRCRRPTSSPPSDIYPTTAIYRFNSDVVEDRDPVQIGIAVAHSRAC